MFKKICAIFLSFAMAFGFISSNNISSYAYSQDKLKKSMEETAALMYKTIPEPVVASIGGEWTVLSLARSGIKVPQKYYDDYYKRVENTVKDAKGILHKMKYTEYSRVILALTSINKDVTNVGGYNLLSYLSDFDNVKKQGINGPIFALIAFDCGNYKIPEDKNASVQTTRQGLIDYILSKEIHKGTSNAGGWALTGNDPDADITFMAIQSLANYMDQEEVKEAVNRGLEVMSKKQLTSGGYSSWGSDNSESVAQAIVALTALGIDLDSDSRFIKTDSKGNKNTLMDGIMKFYCYGGGFAHITEGYDGGSGSGTGINAMATDQAMYALDAYYRYKNGKNKLYDMTDASKTLAIGENEDLDNGDDNTGDKDNDNKNDDNNGVTNDNNGNISSGGINQGNTNSGGTTNQDGTKDSSGNTTYVSKVGTKKVSSTENKSATISIKTVYSGEKDGLIPENKKCIIVEFEKKEKEEIVEFKLSQEKTQYLYYSKELSEKSGKPTYTALFDTSVKKDALLKMDNYEFHKIEGNKDAAANSEESQEDYSNPEKYEIIFGDVNNDKVINAQDVLDIQSILSGKIDLKDERQIIAINVSMDSKIDNGDIDQIMNYFISKSDYTIFTLWDEGSKDNTNPDNNTNSGDKETKEDSKKQGQNN